MTATVTVDSTTRDYYNSFNASLVAGFSALGISGSNVVYNSGSFVIFKVSSGTGTYADAYLKFELNGISSYKHSLTVGTGHTASSSTISGAGTECGAFYANSADYTHRTIKADDNSFGVVQIIDSSSFVVGSYGFVKPTTTTESAADICLVIGLSSIHANAFQNNTSYATLGYRDTYSYYQGDPTKYREIGGTQVNVQPYGNLRNVPALARKGLYDYEGFAHSNAVSGGSSSSNASYYGVVPYSVAFGLESNIDGNLPVMPNVIIKSGGVPIGYNSNLAYCKPGLNPGDNIIVTASSEEYKVISSDGIAIRTV